MSIQKITISNFQSHKHADISLVAGVNVLTGQSDSGKTAVLRAIRWVVENRPSGDAFRSHWGGDTVVGLTLDSGIVVERRRKKGVNDYRIYFPKDKSDILLSAMGQDVPEQVREVLGFSDLNFQLQMDTPFLLSESPGEVARQLNEVADIGKIDSTLANINRMIRDNKSALLAKGQEATRLEAELVAFKDVDRQLKTLEQLQEKDRRAGEMEKMADEIDKLFNRRAYISLHLGVLDHPAIAEALFDRYMGIEAEADSREVSIRKINAYLSRHGAIVGQLDRLPAEDLSEKIVALIALDDTARSKEYLVETIEMKIVVLGEKRDGIASYNLSVKQLEKQWHEQFPEICPLCGK